jgi:outer membrane biosynthesis protein TonB
MPELDVDLVRVLALSLLGVIVIILLLVLASLSRIRKELSQSLEGLRSAAYQPGAGAAPAQAAASPAAISEEAVPAQAQRAEAAAALAASPGPGVEAAAQPAAQAVAEPEPEPVAAVQEPVAEPEPEAEAEPEPVAVEAAAEEPQEQPFERDGRWWFRRGDELLVYDEATGQWVASPHEAAPAAAPQPAGAMATTISGITGASQVSQQREVQAATEPEAAGFWKCPSCGAVNGSTATSCRMCFAARP